MITRKQSIEHFTLRVDDLINSSYILADKKISNLLKTVTASKLFYELISFCAEGFCYEDYFLSLPKGQAFSIEDKKVLIAFGFSLLTAFDLKEQDLLQILSTYYPSESFDKSYKLFADGFLKPFKICVLAVVNEMMDCVVYAPVFCGETKQEKAEPVILSQTKNTEHVHHEKKYLTCYKDIQKILISEKGKIIHCKYVKDAEKEDLLTLLDIFKDKLAVGNKESVKTSFIAYKYAVQAFKRLDSEVDDIGRILKFCEII